MFRMEAQMLDFSQFSCLIIAFQLSQYACISKVSHATLLPFSQQQNAILQTGVGVWEFSAPILVLCRFWVEAFLRISFQLAQLTQICGRYCTGETFPSQLQKLSNGILQNPGPKSIVPCHSLKDRGIFFFCHSQSTGFFLYPKGFAAPLSYGFCSIHRRVWVRGEEIFPLSSTAAIFLPYTLCTSCISRKLSLDT